MFLCFYLFSLFISLFLSFFLCFSLSFFVSPSFSLCSFLFLFIIFLCETIPCFLTFPFLFLLPLLDVSYSYYYDSGHLERVNCIRIFQTTFVLSGSDDSAILLWDLITRETIRRFDGHTAQIQSLQVIHTLTHTHTHTHTHTVLLTLIHTHPQTFTHTLSFSLWFTHTDTYTHTHVYQCNRNSKNYDSVEAKNRCFLFDFFFFYNNITSRSTCNLSARSPPHPHSRPYSWASLSSFSASSTSTSFSFPIIYCVLLLIGEKKKKQ